MPTQVPTPITTTSWGSPGRGALSSAIAAPVAMARAVRHDSVQDEATVAVATTSAPIGA